MSRDSAGGWEYNAYEPSPPMYDDELDRPGPNTKRPAIGCMAITLIVIVLVASAGIVWTLLSHADDSAHDQCVARANETLAHNERNPEQPLVPVEACGDDVPEPVNDNEQIKVIHPVVDGRTITCVIWTNSVISCDWSAK